MLQSPNSSTEFPVPTANSNPFGIATGPDGNPWFTETVADQIGRISPQSPDTTTEFPLPTVNAGPLTITAGPDGNLWFTRPGLWSAAARRRFGAASERPEHRESGSKLPHSRH